MIQPPATRLSVTRKDAKYHLRKLLVIAMEQRGETDRIKAIADSVAPERKRNVREIVIA
jgi:hypothetical protein